MPFGFCPLHDLLLFGLGDVPCVSAAQAFAFVMNQEHHRHRLLLSEHEDFGQDFDDKFHRGVIVVQQKYAVTFRRGGFLVA